MRGVVLSLRPPEGPRSKLNDGLTRLSHQALPKVIHVSLAESYNPICKQRKQIHKEVSEKKNEELQIATHRKLGFCGVAASEPNCE
jgi:hypothetical protein